MKNKEQKIVRLLEEGFSYETIKKMSDLHINKIYESIEEAQTTTVEKCRAPQILPRSPCSSIENCPNIMCGISNARSVKNLGSVQHRSSFASERSRAEMPWCEECARYFTPTAMTANGDCPSCGRHIDEAAGLSDDEKTPWHFKVLVTALIAYLGWRIIVLFV